MYIGLASLLWGLGGFIAKVGVISVGPWVTAFVRSVSFFPVVGLFVLLTGGADFRWNKTTVYAIVAGALTGASIIFSRLAFGIYEVSMVAPILRLRVLVTVGLSILILNEPLTKRKMAGIGAAVAALIFLSL